MSLSEMVHLPCGDDDIGKQRCRLGPCFMTENRISPNSPVHVSGKFGQFICTAWPRQDLCDGFIELDKLVSTKNSNLSSRTLDITSMNENRDKVVLRVTIVLSDTSKVFSYKSRSSHDKFLKYIMNIIIGIVVSKSCILNGDCNDLCKLYGISYLLVTTDSLEDNVAHRISKNDEISIEKFISKERYEQSMKSRKIRLAGLSKPKEMLKELISIPMNNSSSLQELGIECPHGVLLRGPPGCGKTSLVRQIAGECDAFVITVNGPEVFGSRPGESEENLKRVFDKASQCSLEGPCLLFLDEIDSMCPKRTRSTALNENRLVSTLVSFMDNLPKNGSLVVIGATNRPNALDPVLRRHGRFDREIFIGIPSVNQRMEILQSETKDWVFSEDVSLLEISRSTRGFVGADLVSLCREVGQINLSRAEIAQDKPVITMDDFKEALRNIVPSTQRGADIIVDFRPVLWDDIGGLEDIKAQIRQTIEWPIRNPEAFRRMGIPTPKGVLLYGPPGCCKTTLVRAAATSCGATFISINGAQLFSSYVGESERILTEVFQQARASAPSILFLDEIDSIVGKRSEGSVGVQERVLSVLLNQMDGIGIKLEEKTREEYVRIPEGETCNEKGSSETSEVDNSQVVIVAATNRPDLLDPALIRPGRIDRLVFVPPPDVETRFKILQVHAKSMPLHGVNLQQIAAKTENFTGADLENICTEAALLALTEDGLDATEVKLCHFENVLKQTSPTITEDVFSNYASFSGR